MLNSLLTVAVIFYKRRPVMGLYALQIPRYKRVVPDDSSWTNEAVLWKQAVYNIFSTSMQMPIKSKLWEYYLDNTKVHKYIYSVKLPNTGDLFYIKTRHFN